MERIELIMHLRGLTPQEAHDAVETLTPLVEAQGGSLEQINREHNDEPGRAYSRFLSRVKHV